MFEPGDRPRVFALPSGVDFPAELLRGMEARLAGQPPEALARTQLIVNTRRMDRRIRALFDAGPARLLPRLSLITDFGEVGIAGGLPPATPALRRRLELSQLIAGLLDAQPDLAARASLYDLADSLAGLMDEMQGEGVSTETIRGLDVTDMSGHWARAQSFIGIVDDYLGDGSRLDPQARQRAVITALAERWKEAPPQHPVLLAGSTGSRGTTLMLIEAVARLPQGAVILPGYDFDQPESVWADMSDALVSEDHPQFRFSRIMEQLGLEPGDIRPWTDAVPPSPERNRLISLALRPAPFTHAWLAEGPALEGIADATRDLTLVEAEGPRDEALAIALRLRHAAETGQNAALITPDRMLSRRVTAALDQWGILPDDSAGLPLQLSPPGRFLRHVAQLFSQTLTAERLMVLLKHPLCHSGPGRGAHLLNTRDLELHLRRNGPPFPDAESLADYRSGRLDKGEEGPSEAWIAWLSAHFCGQEIAGAQALAAWVARLRNLAEAIAGGGEAEGSGELWEKNAGQKALGVIEALEREAGAGGEMSAQDFADLLGALLAGEEVRDRDAPHPTILIWGTLEARVQGADLLILGGLNEGSWPEAVQPDPWLNRKLRQQAGLLLPERGVGLSAHDFQQAAAAREVWLTRAVRSEDAETVPSRWLNRLMNLLSGLEEGRPALEAMQERGRLWTDWAREMEKAPFIEPALRPSPRPPVAARPARLSVTEIKRLIRDPYAIYAKHVLRLRPLDPLAQEPDALLRGTVLHEVLEGFVQATLEAPDRLSTAEFLSQSRALLDSEVPWPVARHLWLARMRRVAEDFVTTEAARQAQAAPVGFEVRARMKLDPLDFTLTGTADRIDRREDGRLLLYDYKTGSAPTRKQQASFDKQLLIEAAMAEEGAFEGLDPGEVAEALFISFGAGFGEVAAPLDTEPPAKVLEELRKLIGAYMERSQGYTSRRTVYKDTDTGDYDHLARFGEWDRSAEAQPEDLE
ncbi:double-strand break repair protein AddB [Albibacillus kandeliae]|uniref:double-strand break repair protein AddB n=1 Tax=Albibacillus kandeliae TaxID=2174228 RepID=UPI000D69BA45|nr:double-strand break repair protein AddB [Albibacillus kandeliae]